MLTDNERIGKVKWMGESDAKKRPPKEGWSTHDGRVIFVSDKKSELLAKEVEFWKSRDDNKTGEKSAANLKRANDSDLTEVDEELHITKKQKSKKEKSAVIAASQAILDELSHSTNNDEKDSEPEDGVILKSDVKVMSWLSPVLANKSLSTSSSQGEEGVLEQLKKYKDECASLKRERDEAVSAMRRMENTVNKLKEDLPNIFHYIENTLNSVVYTPLKLPLKNPAITSRLCVSTPVRQPMTTPAGLQAESRAINETISGHTTKQTGIEKNTSVKSMKPVSLAFSKAPEIRPTISAVPDIPCGSNEESSSMIDLGHGVKADQKRLALLRFKGPTQLARQMMDVIFTRDELSTSSVTGRASNKKAGEPVKPALDPAKVAALLSYVRTKYPDSVERLVKSAMAEKLQELRVEKPVLVSVVDDN